jgi:hypothetical protein
MKLLLTIALFSSPVFAASEVKCNSSPVDFTITAPNGIALGAPITVLASGVLETQELAQIDMIESSQPPLAVIDITTLDGTGKENIQTSIRARLEIPLAADGKVESGAGKIQITYLPAIHPRRMLTRYDLNNCTGNL